ncbi:class I SAM-dependent methyltransferase [Streptomyces beijiangensis]|uniref:Class I SAM-dependent methyltransferase n=1 Tax=Streptomyces beijiangensis TaxID=163361 RepID=A0A939F477_9ACTN|nr:class I SAM-dependent methyltransferase [Streptomyces beijiangensis]MBO0511434.1 class I SAM-dependent methyltransferase [Streptomyces beijiangensis]
MTTDDFALSFDAVAAQYAAARPGYPPALFDAVEAMADQPLKGARVYDIGAGTGIATRLLRDRGAHVTAVEPGPQMAAQLHQGLPDVPLVRGDGNHLPLLSGSADFITYAQSWHWTDPARSIPEALRVLAPRGALALWWNIPDPATAWSAAQEDRLKKRCPGYHSHGIAPEAPGIIKNLDHALNPAFRLLHWKRTVPLDTHLAHLGSRSYFATMGPQVTEAALAQERAELLSVFPDGQVEEAYALDVTVVRKPA